MESIEGVAVIVRKALDLNDIEYGLDDEDTGLFAQALMKDPAFRRLMAEELVKVDMEPINLCPEGGAFDDFYSYDQLIAAVLKDRERLAEEFAAQPHMEFFGREIADFIRTERTE